jgi:hypothetical protein
MLASALALLAGGIAAAGDRDAVPLFTNDDLDRMFGPVPAKVSDPVDKSRPEDWLWVEQFIDRQYARIDADRGFDLSRRLVDGAERRIDEFGTSYVQPLAWRLGYPASVWWSSVRSRYASSGAFHGHDFDDASRHAHGHGRR